MKIAVTYNNGDIFQHFGHCESFKIYDIENNEIKDTEVLDSDGSGHSALADLLNNHKVDVLICGGIGGCAVAALSEYGIELYAGQQGSADDAISKYLAGELEQVSEANCSHHHEHGSHSGGHSCGHCH